MEKDQHGEETVEVAASFTLLFAYENGGLEKRSMSSLSRIFLIRMRNLRF